VNANALLASVIIGSVGMGLFMYGKRQRRTPHLVGRDRAHGVHLLRFEHPAHVRDRSCPGGLLYLASYLGL
jgi:hypothetical protein